MDALTGSTRSADGTEIGWFRTGSGPALVLVHGTTADHSRWAPVLQPLADRYTVYAVDRRGRGISGEGGPYHFDREVEDVVAVVDAIPGPVNLLGHSFGALCSLEAALRTSNIAKLVLYEPPLPAGTGLVPPDVVARVNELVAAGDREGALVAFMTEVVRLPREGVERMRAMPAWQARIAAAHTLTREAQLDYTFDAARFEKLDVPTLLLLGGESPDAFATPVRRLEEALPDARVAVLAGQHHNAMDTAPELFVREVLSFLDA